MLTQVRPTVGLTSASHQLFPIKSVNKSLLSQSLSYGFSNRIWPIPHHFSGALLINNSTVFNTWQQHTGITAYVSFKILRVSSLPMPIQGLQLDECPLLRNQSALTLTQSHAPG